MQNAKATDFCAVAPDVGTSSTVWNLLLYVTLLDSRVFMLLPDFGGKIRTPVVDSETTVRQSGMVLLYVGPHSASERVGRYLHRFSEHLV